ncbi:uncharacterized protein [Amphiura filiformis]|uniref:uncharacterized protein n=1 Tax=Amphiura filiformis TaxID=82378 RepID=UPI003B2251D1
MVMSIIAATGAPFHVGQQAYAFSQVNRSGYNGTIWPWFFFIIAGSAGFVEFFISIASAATCCKGAYCCKCCWSCCCDCCCGPAAVQHTVQYGHQPNLNTESNHIYQSNTPYENQPSTPYYNQGFK